MGEFSPSHWLIVGIVVVLFFGSKRLPDAARALGRSMRILKSETQGLRDDAAPGADAAPAPAQAQAQAPDAIQHAIQDGAFGTAQDKRDRAARLREEAARIESTAPGATNT
ncbi:Sec-independent protein translocase subunit TatA [Actinomadura montaniterrae]|uniref:Sec-independent protein translocase protein TatA n=1 Tax=Actinomadura montaniterrae TaxID=1803903 RepID=A0A6L3VNE9_9ACTN|nr:Sec-independent protein translocase subunit TatA [Actinomadura montaniterrae]KAB2372269.1 Sec-independent protein translocase subunit TatA [Actinomadura montaniterrae]